ncbi:hypothetical protein BUALT_Bualt05G0087000 [Buddleja alternifolia]|uniref:glycerol-3-phosphate 1-O-acyltransferase n=1 Tax=Buddleja alternifolia TaxID=168488 RepID=A0AAV6XU56_9LAMI|nr:hypothetical protein BUALT_Bualt05G0087000 [Buddleja alternifolia]
MAKRKTRKLTAATTTPPAEIHGQNSISGANPAQASSSTESPQGTNTDQGVRNIVEDDFEVEVLEDHPLLPVLPATNRYSHHTNETTMILSTTSPSSTKLFTCSTAPRVSSSHSTSRIFYSVKSGCARKWSRRRSSLVFCASNPVDKMKSSFRNTAAAAAVVDSASDQHEISPHQTFLDARTEEGPFISYFVSLILLALIEYMHGSDILVFYLLKPRNETRFIYLSSLVIRLCSVSFMLCALVKSFLWQVFQSGHPKSDEIVLSNMAVTLDRVFLDARDPFQFSPYHEAIREPFDYYMFGQKYIRPLIDFRTSFVGNIFLFDEMEKKLEQGENVILISNHQTEADPAVIALLLESTNPFIAENIIFVAGDRVVTDPLCKPFSMGRNLLCVYSKNHMNDDPELIDMKKRANTKSLKEMALLLRGGSKIIWIAPSGGRDRPDPVTKEWFPFVKVLCTKQTFHWGRRAAACAVGGNSLAGLWLGWLKGWVVGQGLLCWGLACSCWRRSGAGDRSWSSAAYKVLRIWDLLGNNVVVGAVHGCCGVVVAPFDASSVDNMRRLAEHAGVPGRVYPLAISCHDIMPPPAQVEKEIGERRVISFHGVGLSVAPSINYHEVASALEDLEEAKLAYTESLYSSVCEQYNVLKSAIHGKQGLGASTPTVSLSQPWQ